MKRNFQRIKWFSPPPELLKWIRESTLDGKQQVEIGITDGYISHIHLRGIGSGPEYFPFGRVIITKEVNSFEIVYKPGIVEGKFTLNDNGEK
jgi:hypothetical protein